MKPLCLAFAMLTVWSCGPSEVDPSTLPPGVKLTVEAPLAGEVAAEARVTLEPFGHVLVAEIRVARAQSPDTVFRAIACSRKCTQTLDLPTGKYEVWGWMQTTEEGPEFLSERQQVEINSTPLVPTPIASTTTTMRILMTGENKLDLSTVNTDVIKVSKAYQLKAYNSFRGQYDIGMASKDVPVEVSYSGNILTLKGSFVGPGNFTVTLKGVKNQYGKGASGDVTVPRPYFIPVESLGADVSSGQVWMQPRLTQSKSKDLFLFQQGKVSKLVSGSFAEVATWTASEFITSTIDSAGTPYLAEGSVAEGALVRRWDGTAWVSLPALAAPAFEDPVYRSVTTSLQFDSDDHPVVCVVSSSGVTKVSNFAIARWNGSAWEPLVQRAGLGILARVGADVAFTTPASIELLQNNALVPLVLPGTDITGVPAGELKLFNTDILNNAQGETFVLYSNKNAGLRGTGALKWSNGQWSLLGNPVSGSYISTAWSDTTYLEGHEIQAWTLDPNGSPVLFSRENVYLGASDGVSVYRALLSAYRLVNGAWAPLAGVDSPALEGEEPSTLWEALKTAWNPMAPHSARYAADGSLWFIKAVGTVSGGVARSEWQLVRAQP